MNVDRLQGLLEFGADPFVLRKTSFPWFQCDCKEAPSLDDGSTVKHIEPAHERGQAAGPAGVWGLSLRLEKKIPRFRCDCKEAPSPEDGSTAKRLPQLTNVGRWHGLLEFGADPFVLKKDVFLYFGVIAERRHHQMTGLPPSTLSRFLNVDRLQGLLEFTYFHTLSQCFQCCGSSAVNTLASHSLGPRFKSRLDAKLFLVRILSHVCYCLPPSWGISSDWRVELLSFGIRGRLQCPTV